MKQLRVRIDKQLLDKLHYIAQYEGRSLNSQLNMLVKRAVRKDENEIGKIDPADCEHSQSCAQQRLAYPQAHAR